MDVREKLVELLCSNSLHRDGVTMYDVADHLVANGVTVQENCKACAEATQNCIVKLQEQIAELRSVQEWISVKDRLPEDDSDVLAYLRIGEEGRIYPANYARGMWFDCLFNTPATSTTTHWMPLPQPPKGE